MPMTPEEIAIAGEVGFDWSVAEFVRGHSRTPLDRLMAMAEDGSIQPGPGLSVVVADGDEAERLMKIIGPSLAAQGYRLLEPAQGFQRLKRNR